MFMDGTLAKSRQVAQGWWRLVRAEPVPRFFRIIPGVVTSEWDLSQVPIPTI
jgi:hypothetical protein